MRNPCFCIRCKGCTLMLQLWARLAFGVRFTAYSMKKVLEHSGEETWSQSSIVYPIHQSAFMLMSTTKMYMWKSSNWYYFCSPRRLIKVWVQLLRMVPGLDKRQDNAGADVLLRLLGGGLAGITAATITYPLDLVRTRLAAQVFQV